MRHAHSREITSYARLLLPALGLLTFGCAPPPLGDSAASGEPSIRITWPPPETEIVGCELIAVEVENFTLVDPDDAGLVEGQGHYHVFHPGGYEACYKPYCFVDFSSLTETAAPYFRVVLADNSHNDVLDENGDTYEYQIPFEFVAGECTLDVSEFAGD